jgi:hypothetical protein
MVIKTTDGHTTIDEGGDIFIIIKIAGFFLPSIKPISAETNTFQLQINILEAIIDDIITNKQLPNAIFGVNVMLLLPIMKEIKIIDCEGFKLWCIIYFIWNMEFCKNKGFGTQESFAHNFPALIKALISFGYTPNELLQSFLIRRAASIFTMFIDRHI